MSRLYKSADVVSARDMRQLEWFNRYERKAPETVVIGPDEETVSLRDQILNDAELFAKQRLAETAEQIEAMYAEAQEQIERWWQERRDADLQHYEQVRQEGYQVGYDEGKAESLQEVTEQWTLALTEARAILDAAYSMKEQIIQEAEPFLVDLSAAIAEKIIGKQLILSPEWSIDLIRKSLERRREQGVITLCIAPQHLTFVQAAREELTMAIDSQAELQIVPDVSVKDHGCVIRSAFGSIDARIDTQLSEIKRELIQLALQAEERGDSNGGE
ncbi:FliH/SctL family protein [Paenibacillus sp. GCM10027626]|uniref:FliH/SctL family protein n=1 Tax=Paenibacillus sp. GCM10027626 TaxID=3273411 RepID=UPI003641D1F2